MDKLLYFPYINLPRTDWTIRTLMYYESIGTIVPNEYFYDPENNYDPHMLELVRSELVIPINPIETLDNPWEVSNPFIEFVNGPDFKIKKRKRNFIQPNYTRIQNDKFKVTGSKIHADKFDKEIFYQLEQIGLARRDKNNYNWFFVETRTANLLMTFLASVISSKLEMRPTTDIINKSYKIAGKKIEHQKKQLISKRETILRELIPFPQEIDLTKLRRFKDKYISLLESFRNKIELIVLDAKLIEGSELFNEKVKELKLRKDELSAKMNESQFKNIIFGSICGIIGAYQGLASAETTGAVIGGLPGFTSAIYSALRIEKAENIFDQSGMKYLALMDKRLK